VYDALTTKRVYKPAYTHEAARTAILEGDGSQFDPAIVEAFLAQESHFITVHQLLTEDDAFAVEDPVPAGIDP
jgi:response regulator RpfG family c-di-GMP phosphodiesterase